jgi:Flp pilus assembly protein TadD
MDRFPIATKIIMVTAMLTLAACGDSQSKSKERTEFPASQTRESNSNHTALLNPAIPDKAEISTMGEVMPSIVEEKVAVPEPEMDPENFSAFMRRGSTRFRANDFAGAKADYQAAVEKRSESFRPRVQLARTLLSLGDVEGAREHVELAIEIDGASSLAWNTLGRVELAEQDNDAAVVSFERAVEENEDNSYAWNNLGFVHMEEEDYEAAADALEAATSGTSPTGYMWNNLGMAYEHLDRIALARASYRQAADLGSERAQDNFDRLEGVVSLVVESADVEETQVDEFDETIEVVPEAAEEL